MATPFAMAKVYREFRNVCAGFLRHAAKNCIIGDNMRININLQDSFWKNLAKKLLLILLLIPSFSQVNAADLYDLRVFPHTASQTLRFEGVISEASQWSKPTGKRARLSGLIRSWLASDCLQIESEDASCSVIVSDGEFSGTISPSSLASFSLTVIHEQIPLYHEHFTFPEKFDLLVVSDIDDTILVTEVTSKSRMLLNSMFRSVENRKPVTGTPELYQSMRQGELAAGTPHFFYLSSSPAFLSRTLKAFLKFHDFPQGTMILKKSLTDGSHQHHKSGWLSRIAETYPDKPILLLGDSGEKDPAIYTGFAESLKNPKRIMAVVIRDVSGSPEQQAKLETIRKRLADLGVPFICWHEIESLKESLRNLAIVKMLAPGQ